MTKKRPQLEWSDGAAGPVLSAMTTTEAALRAFFGEQGLSRSNLAWMDRGRCAETDPEIFFAENLGAGIRDAKQVCGRCPVQQRCLEYAVDNHIQDGIWGGLTLLERRQAGRREAEAA